MHPGCSRSLLPACLLLIGTVACRATPEFAEEPQNDLRDTKPSAPRDDDRAEDAPASNGGRGGTSASDTGSKASKDPPAGTGGDGGAPTLDDADSHAGAPSTEEPGPMDAPPTTCGAQSVTFGELGAGSVRSNVKVELTAVATSQKFLLSHAKSGSCLFGAFAGSEPDEQGPNGILIVSYGNDAPDGSDCPTGTDGIPDDLTPGDAVTAVGYVTSYAPSSCSVVPAPQLMVDAACPLAVTGRRDAPAPFTLTLEQADALARGTDTATLRTFAGGLVRLENVSTRRPTEGVGSVGPYGVVALNETSLELHNDLEYGDLTLGGPGDVTKSLELPYPTAFESVTGLVYLDYCTWSLAPRSRCDDLVPGSANCR